MCIQQQWMIMQVAVCTVAAAMFDVQLCSTESAALKSKASNMCSLLRTVAIAVLNVHCRSGFEQQFNMQNSKELWCWVWAVLEAKISDEQYYSSLGLCSS
ncbi:unnamed protein product [Amaranthus hypochondriacus]